MCLTPAEKERLADLLRELNEEEEEEENSIEGPDREVGQLQANSLLLFSLPPLSHL